MKSGGHGRIDRRVARTRALLQDALIALIPEHGYAALNVEDICQRANVGRSTFYAHYPGKDALRRATIDAHLQSLAQEHSPDALPTSGRLFGFSQPFFEHAQAFRPLHRALLASGSDTIHDEMRERVRRAVRQELTRKRTQLAGLPLEVAVQFVAGAFLAVLAWWIADGPEITVVEVDDMFQRLARDGVGSP